MPIYEYRCKACGHEKEVLQRMSDKPLTKCPECGKRAFHKLVSAAGFQLKGTGWYETDFKKDKRRNLHDEKEPASKDGVKKDDKPAAKTSNKADTKPSADNKSGVG